MGSVPSFRLYFAQITLCCLKEDQKTVQKATFCARVTRAADPTRIGKKQMLVQIVSDLPLTPRALVKFPFTGG